MFQSRIIADSLGLDMKISDVEYQGDGAKATFYYTANGRVDFRQLIRELAGKFSIRVEMRQIGARQEAARLGGIGSCGRELCCSTWLTDFRTVNTAAARYQQLALNPQKLAGQCGKLKCCLNYELDSYLDALKDFPETQVKLKTQRGEAVFQKKDIFKKIMWYAYPDEILNWVPLQLEDVMEIVALNERGELPPSIEAYRENREVPVLELANVVGQDDLNRFDIKRKPKKKKRPGAPQGQRPMPVTEVQANAKAAQQNAPERPVSKAINVAPADGSRPQQNRNKRRPQRRGPNKNNNGEAQAN
jgi:cell fate regulator YaaT (PSP1 superfamily)